VNIRQLELRDLDAVLAIQSASPETARWSRADYERVAQGDFSGWVAESEPGLIGFLVARRVADEVEILNLAIVLEARRRGAATLLLDEALSAAKDAGARRAFLEVRDSNIAAILFYERQGFFGSGRRANYYSDPVEDALVLTRSLD
jgi:ribosomal-protein-alanine N-acetyltransferase